MKFKKTAFQLQLHKSKIAKVSYQYSLRGGMAVSRNCEVSYPKTLPNEKRDMCQSTDPLGCP